MHKLSLAGTLHPAPPSLSQLTEHNTALASHLHSPSLRTLDTAVQRVLDKMKQLDTQVELLEVFTVMVEKKVED